MTLKDFIINQPRKAAAIGLAASIGILTLEIIANQPEIISPVNTGLPRQYNECIDILASQTVLEKPGQSYEILSKQYDPACAGFGNYITKP